MGTGRPGVVKMAKKKKANSPTLFAASEGIYYFVEFAKLGPSCVHLRLLARLRVVDGAWRIQNELGYKSATAYTTEFDPKLQGHLGFAKLARVGNSIFFCTAPNSKQLLIGRIGTWLLERENLWSIFPEIVPVPPQVDLYFCDKNVKQLQGPYRTFGGSQGLSVVREDGIVRRFPSTVLGGQIVKAGHGRHATIAPIDLTKGTPINELLEIQKTSVKPAEQPVEPLQQSSQAAPVRQVDNSVLDELHSSLQRTSEELRKKKEELVEINTIHAELRETLTRAEQEYSVRIHELDKQVAAKQESLSRLDEQLEQFHRRVQISKHALVQEFAAHSVLFSELQKQPQRTSDPVSAKKAAPPRKSGVEESKWFRQTFVPYSCRYLTTTSERVALAIHLAFCSSHFTVLSDPHYARCYVDSLGDSGRLFYVHCSPAWVDWTDAWKFGLRRPWRYAKQHPDVHVIAALAAPEQTCSALWLTPLIDLAAGLADEIGYVDSWLPNLRLAILPGSPESSEHKLPCTLPPLCSGVRSLTRQEGAEVGEPRLTTPDNILWPSLDSDRLSSGDARELRLAKKLRDLGLESEGDRIARKVLHDWPGEMLAPFLDQSRDNALISALSSV